MIEAPEAQRIERGDGPGPHRKDVAQDAADARGRPLVGLDERGMVVALHLEDRRKPIPDVDDAGILARTLKHPGAFGREKLQKISGAFVAAVLRPHHGEDPQLRVVGFSTQNRDDLLILFLGQAVAGDHFRGHRRLRIAF